ncbi:phosphotransferase enzyme family protein [Deinococcus sonorensis]|uniref:Phosphotransferase n=2 Tax=Deinococcus sonorensis TaxID=309891 RepID=A0AAU7UGP2_9DEIO
MPDAHQTVATAPLPHLPAAFSVLDPVVLAAHLETHYGLTGPVSCEFLAGGVNDTYLARTTTGPVVYRLYRRHWRTAPEVAWEIALLAHLRRHGVAVSVALPDRTGADQQWVSVAEGSRLGALFSFAPGRELHWKEERDVRCFGASVATLHDAMDAFDDPGGRFHLDLEHLIDTPLATVLPFLADRPDDAAYLAALGARTRARLEDLAAHGLTEGTCHGDLHGGNVHVADEVCTHFDFDCGGRGWRAYDVAVFWWSLSLGNKPDSLWEAFLDGYGRARLTPADWSAVPWFVVARCVWLLGLHAGLRPRVGAAYFSGQGYWEHLLNFLRTWETERLADPGVEQPLPSS